MTATRTLAVALSLVLAAMATADDEIWGQAAAGLQLRAEAPPVPIGGSPLLTMVDVELRNVGKTAIPHERLGVRTTLELPRRKHTGQLLVELPTITPLEVRAAEIPVDGSVTWLVRVWRTSEHVPEQLTSRMHFSARDETDAMHHLTSREFVLDFRQHPPARKMVESDLDAGWTGASVLVYRESGLFVGSTAFEVWPSGLARVFKSRTGREDPDLPPGIHQATLIAAEQVALADALKTARAWDLAPLPLEHPPPTDGVSVEIVLIEGEAALRETFLLSLARDPERFAELRTQLRQLMVRVVKRQAKGKR